MELHLCMGCMREKTNPGPCPYCGFQEENYHPLPSHLPLYSILNGKYLVGKVLGCGGFGITYMGYDLNLQIKLAIKEYFPCQDVWRDIAKGIRVSLNSGKRAEDYRDGLSRFLREAQALAKFWDVPGIVPVKDYFQENNTAYIVMKFVEGKNLKQYLDGQGGKMEPDRAFSMMKSLLVSLSSVHKSGLIHGDINPKNIIVGPDDQLCLIDFGAAVVFDNETLTLFPNEYTPGFAPPEQYGGSERLGPWSDIYSLCATIYRAITGMALPDAMDRFVLQKSDKDPLKKPSQLGISLSSWQEEALMKGLELEKEKRFSSLEEFLEVLYAVPKKSRDISYSKIAATLFAIVISGFIFLGLGKGEKIEQKNVETEKDDLTVSTELSAEQNAEHEEKIQHIRSVFYEINAKTDYHIIAKETSREYVDKGVLVKAVFANDANNLTIPVVECYYEKNHLIFAYGVDGTNEYRYYFENGKLIREIGADNIIIDYLDGDGFLKTTDSKAAKIYKRGQKEIEAFAKDQ